MVVVVEDFKPDDASSLFELFYETIRNINIADYNQQQVEAWAPQEIDPNQWAESFLNKMVWVAKEGDERVGFCELKADGYIDRFYISKNRIGLGIGRSFTKSLKIEQ